jgi:hypothetical protein
MIARAALILSIFALALGGCATRAYVVEPGGVELRLVRDVRRDGRRVAILTRDLFYCFPPTNELFIVPAFFESDFASIPQQGRPWINPFGDHAEAAIVHDWLYAVGEPGQRRHADEIFRYAMREQGVSLIARNLMYQAVHHGGERSYGAPAEWRFQDPDSLAPIAVAPTRPSRAAVAIIDCDTFERDILALRQTYRDIYMPRTRPTG